MWVRRTLDRVVVGLAFVAVVVSSLFAQSMLVRYTADHQPQHRAWAIALAMFALASVALASGTATGWDNGTFRAFYLLGAVVNVPWLAMGTVYLLVRAEVAPAGALGPGAVQRVRGRGAAELPDGDGPRHRDPGGEGRVRRPAPHPRRGGQRRRRRW